MGRTPKDIDHLWVGATPEDMLAMGMHQVGAAFPVFLDSNGDEHALARIERKVGVGYNGFECQFDSSITVEQDLARRDLTMNSMAVLAKDWNEFMQTKDERLIVDPYHGWMAINMNFIKHTSDAFAEDPIRVLRAARFAARYGFAVDGSTIELMRKIVPELYHVPQERIWTEFEKGLMEPHPEKMIDVLRKCGALEREGPLGPYSIVDEKQLVRAAKLNKILSVRFTTVSRNFTLDDYATCRIPTDCAVISAAFKHTYGELLQYCSLPSERRVQLLERLKALNDRYLLDKCLEVLECGIRVESDLDDIKTQVGQDLAALKTVDAAAIAASCSSGKEIKQKIFEARVAAL
jgi:tRNA nucleotidyltransferase (CCA-adding enzyme)